MTIKQVCITCGDELAPAGQRRCEDCQDQWERRRRRGKPLDRDDGAAALAAMARAELEAELDT